MAEILEIWGGHPLYGTVELPAAKNSVLPLLAASVLCGGKVCLEKVPHLSDVEVSLALLRELGISARWCGGKIVVYPSTQLESSLSSDQMERMRASVLFLAPVLSRTGRVEASLPGGCSLGARPIDIHLDGLKQMGASVHWHEERLYLSAPRGLTGTSYTLRYPSVGATETMLLAAVCANGTTVLRGVAKEPEIVDLAHFLNACGGQIQGAGTETIHIVGSPRLTGCSYTPIPDRIVASTVACAVAAAGGKVTMCGCDGSTLEPVLEVLEQAGCRVLRETKQVTVERHRTLHPVHNVTTGAYPAFPTDAAPLVAAALLTADGQSAVCDTVFSKRFACAEGFSAMGANVRVENAVLRIGPCRQLHGTMVNAPDLRGGAALVIAALAANGKTKIDQIHYIQRGYEDMKEMLRQIGARIHVKKT